MSYCTIAEAWGVDSFKTKKKMGCAVPSPKASADPYDPFNPEASGRELSGIYNGPNPNAPNAQRTRMSQSGQLIAEPFETQQMGMSDKTTYSGLANDYSYACKTYGVCSPIEKFAGGPPLPTTPSQAKTSPGTCGTQVPIYQYPLSDDIKKNINKALQVQNEEFGGQNTITNNNQVPTPPQKSVQGYLDDEELQDYLTLNELQSTPAAKPIQMTSTDTSLVPSITGIPSKFEEPKSTPYVRQTELVSEITNARSPSAKSSLSILEPYDWKRTAFDLLIYVVTGILLIFLLEQMFKLAIMVGMKQTVSMLEPYLAEIMKKAVTSV